MAPTDDFQRLIVEFIRAEVHAAEDLEIDPDENLFAQGHVDSMGIMRLIAHLEAELDLQIPPSDLIPENFRTIRVMAVYLSRIAAA